MNLDVFFYTLYILFGMLGVAVAVFHAVKLVFPDQKLLEAQARLGVESAVRQYKHWSLSFLSPFYRAMVPRLQQIRMPIYRQKKKKLFVAAGLDDQFDADEFVGLKICAALLGVVFIGMLINQAGAEYSIGWFFISLIVGFFAPDYVVYETKKKRQKRILLELPTMMDLLMLSVEAGMDFMAAISRVVGFSKPGPLREELSRVMKEIQVGTTRADALRNMADRVQLSELSSFSSILIQADEMGSSIGQVLRAQADLLRLNRFQRAEREGAKATQKLLLPLVICIFPSVFIVIIGPVICDIYYNQSWLRNLIGG